MKVYNKIVIDWLLGQQQFCLTLERICSRVKQKGVVMDRNMPFGGYWQ